MSLINQDLIMNLSICICTRNRPEEIKKALKSIEKSSIKIYEVVVSDDSTDEKTKELIGEEFPYVTYAQGPRTGLCANRNNAIKYVKGTHVLFMDDDVILGESFAEQVKTCLSSNKGIVDRAIVTGLELKNQIKVIPHDQNFLGFQKKKYKQGEPLKTVIINSTIFPMALFSKLKFDEQLRYGYDEVDITTRAIKNNFLIILCDSAINHHYPSEVNRDYYKPYMDASRIYVTYKRYFYSEEKKLKAISFALIAALHTTIHGLSSKQGLKNTWFTLQTTAKYIVGYQKDIIKP
ncbi:glycosyltransferase family 2 protein [Paenibacillus daejeonensis]|uniref:glycosyltransferase family 2 protein n=1 Tax=Paenibacillus daejeonensis TaxID=135193 RepID=UPI000361808D|nr:glycosyltransferase family 2 protein [Paenibacillus daejeonensis]